MISATRREALIGALAVPALAGVPRMAWARGDSALLLHDPLLETGRRFAELHGGESLAIDGDRIRFARAVFERRPALVVGVTRPADALLLEEVGREAGYWPDSASADRLQEMLGASRTRDRGLVLSWVLAARG